ncbi:MAG: hypothetical protein HYW50_00870 [Candidatus Diapherotrites archaeon]|nr:hypothetical protein [Candidatus Diapherotrites archaeon]
MSDKRYHVHGFFGKLLLRQSKANFEEQILDLCDGSHTAEEIARKASVPIDTTERMLKRLHSEGTITPVKIWNRTVYLKQ